MTNLININAPTVPLAVSTATARVQFGTQPADTILIDNTLAGNTDCYVKTGGATVVATVNDTHISANEKATYEIDPSHTYIAAITSTGTTSLRIQRGEGI